MKKLIFIIYILCISVQAFAQFGDYYLLYEGYRLGYKSPNKVKIAASCDSTFKKNGKSQREVLTYSPDSLLITYEKTNIKGKLLWKREYNYQNRLLKSMHVYNGKSKLINRNEYEYLSEGYRSSLKKYKGNGTLISQVKTNYDWLK
jgi:hypothetical protein